MTCIREMLNKVELLLLLRISQSKISTYCVQHTVLGAEGLSISVRESP